MILHISIILYLAAVMADIVTTKRGLRGGGTTETNGWIAWLQGLTHGWFIVRAAVGSIVVVTGLANATAWPVILSAAVVASFAWNNVRVSR